MAADFGALCLKYGKTGAVTEDLRLRFFGSVTTPPNQALQRTGWDLQ